jgi:hypothetical protein
MHEMLRKQASPCCFTPLLEKNGVVMQDNRLVGIAMENGRRFRAKASPTVPTRAT